METIKQEIQEDRLSKGYDSEEENTYHTIIINYFEMINVNVNASQMEQWSIFINVTNYAQYIRNPIEYFKLDVKALEPENHKRIYKRLEEDDR